ncbi:TIGR00341 family protein [Algivirga pacifica]|uniref:TIGR00341 family protein n=1 Tax=Algivirga pacifica TaxID=1162670 RepID=A0ABP9CX93_9BACT
MQNKNVRYFFISVKRVAHDILSIKEGSDPQQTLEGITKDISFRGPTAWILIFSIFIASIGLNANSPAVIIGAMLISPLMGPILGIGTAVGTHDMDMLLRALKNLGIAVGISLLTSTLYFLITPLAIEQSEILARTKPTILDVLVAMFGGFSGIIAGSRKEKTNVIPGVAIATALMPPLCTAGFGLATGKWIYFFGAFYLFFINSVFISLSTFIVVRYLDFPVKQFIDHKKYQRYKLFLISFLLITVVPSGIIFSNVIQETRFRIAVDAFIKESTSLDGSELLTHKVNFSDTLSVIDLYYMGKRINDDQVLLLNDRLSQYKIANNEDRWFPLTKKTVVRVHQEDGNTVDIEKKFDQYNSQLQIRILEDIYKKNEEVIQGKDLKIKLLEERILQYAQTESDTLPLQQLVKEIQFQYPEVERFSISEGTHLQLQDSIQMDTLTNVLIKLKKGMRYTQRKAYAGKMESWLQVRLNNPGIKVIEYN